MCLRHMNGHAFSLTNRIPDIQRPKAILGDDALGKAKTGPEFMLIKR